MSHQSSITNEGMIDTNAAFSLRPRMRIGGLVYLTYFITAISGQLLMKGLILNGDPSTIAGNILSHRISFESGFSLSVIAIGCYLAWIAILFCWFAGINRAVSLVATLFSVVGCAVQLLASTLQSPQLLLQTTARHFNSPELLGQVSATLLHVALVFFGAFDVLVGYLILRSLFLPRVLGSLMLIAGCGWLLFLVPPIAATLTLYIEVFGFAAEAVLMLWLVVKG